MKKIIITGIALVAIISGSVGYWNQPNKRNISELQWDNIEALSEEEYVIGFFGTNWKKYRIQCTKTVGFDYIVTYTKTTTYWADVCGYGTGFCLSQAGC